MSALEPSAAQTSLRFYGHGVSAPDLDRVKISLQPNRPVDVGGDFTIEFWMKAALAENTGTVSTGNDGWITGNIIFDRDVYGGGDNGDRGIALGGGRLAFGIHNGAWGQTIVGDTVVADGQWHHIAVTRQRGPSGSTMRIFVDGSWRSEAGNRLASHALLHQTQVSLAICCRTLGIR